MTPFEILLALGIGCLVLAGVVVLAARRQEAETAKATSFAGLGISMLLDSLALLPYFIAFVLFCTAGVVSLVAAAIVHMG